MDKPDIYSLIMDMGATCQVQIENLAKTGQYQLECAALQLVQTAAFQALNMLPVPWWCSYQEVEREDAQ